MKASRPVNGPDTKKETPVRASGCSQAPTFFTTESPGRTLSATGRPGGRPVKGKGCAVGWSRGPAASSMQNRGS